MKKVTMPLALGGVFAILFLIYKKMQDDAEAVKNESAPEPAQEKAVMKQLPKGAVPQTKNFSLSEFHCKDGTKVPVEYYGNVQYVMNQLQAIRNQVGKPIKINSAYRTAAYNKKVGGKAGSAHLEANAADIVISGMTPLQVAVVIRQMQQEGTIVWGGLGLYDTFVHYDTSTKRDWNYSTKWHWAGLF